MSCVIALDHDNNAVIRGVVKGAPEVMQPMFVNVPNNYEQVHTCYSRQGCRVLALGYKMLTLKDNADDRKAVHFLSHTRLMDRSLICSCF